MTSFKSNVVFSQRVDNQQKKTDVHFQLEHLKTLPFLIRIVSNLYFYAVFLSSKQEKRATPDVKEWEKSH